MSAIVPMAGRIGCEASEPEGGLTLPVRTGPLGATRQRWIHCDRTVAMHGRRPRLANVSCVPVKAQRALVGCQTILSRAEGTSVPDALRGRV